MPFSEWSTGLRIAEDMTTFPPTAVQNMCMLHHGFWMWKDRKAPPLPSPSPLLGRSAPKFLCSLKTHSHHPTSPAAKQPSPWRRVAASLLKGSKWTLTQIPSCLAVNLQASCWLHFTGDFIHLPSVSPTPKRHLFLFQYCRCLAGTLSKCWGKCQKTIYNLLMERSQTR